MSGNNRRNHIAVVGAGWAGLAAAIAAHEAGQTVTVFEAARSPGGRARTVHHHHSQVPTAALDNGQHILIGAYTETLALMRRVGVDPDQVLLRLPLALVDARGQGLALPDLPPPWDALVGIARTRGWSWSERLALLRRALDWRLGGFTCSPGDTVADLCHGLPARLWDDFIEPLCVSALNTPGDQASGEVFLRVLRDALFGGRGGSHLLLPRTDLGGLLPDAALAWLRARGASVHLGRRVQSLCAARNTAWEIDGEPFDAVVLATPAWDAARLCRQAAESRPDGGAAARLRAWSEQARALTHTAITTVYALGSTPLARPMLALRAAPGAPAQFVFDRGQLGGPSGMLAFVVSASAGERTVLAEQVTQQARDQLGQAIRPVQVLCERRATFACTPGLQRPATAVAPALWAAGDFVAGPYPATLEGAVRSGLSAGRAASGRERP